jgi:type IX secretion system PorP/SprF family membrane protein
MKTKIYIFLALCFVINYSFGQDYHFSQFEANPFYINPALTGERLTEFKGTQFNVDYRDQSSQFTKFRGAFRSVAVGADEILDAKFSTGQFLYNDRSASGSFNTFGFIASGAHKIINATSNVKTNHALTVGLQLGFMNKSINPDKFTYDQQYTSNADNGFDKTLPSGEVFTRQSYFNFSANFGVYYRGTSKDRKLTAFSGFAIYNIAKPNQTFFDDGFYSPLPLRFVLHGGAIYKATNQLDISPQILYMNQAKAEELLANVLMFYKIEGTAFETIYGFGTRIKNAVIFNVGLRTKGMTYRISYDVVTNPYLKAYRRNGLEFSAVIVLKKKNAAPGGEVQGSPSPGAQSSR